MWLKVHYPAHFMAAVLTSWMGAKVSELVPYLNECRRLGIEVLPPDVNQSSAMFEVSKDGKGIHFGLTSVKGVGTKAVENILEIKANHAIKSLVDFISLTNSSVNKTVVSSLVKAGAFDFLGFNRRTLLQMTEDLIEINSKIKQKITNNKKRKNPVSDISSFFEPLYIYAPTIQDEFSAKELCEMERELTGFYMKHHPLDGYIEYIRSKVTNTSSEINDGIKITFNPSDEERDFVDVLSEIAMEELDEEDRYVRLPKGQTVITGGVIKQLNPITIKNGRSAGKQMATFIIEDAYQGDIRCTAFPEVYTKFRNTIREGNVVFIKGGIDYYRDNAQVNVGEAKEINPDIARKYQVQDNVRKLADIEEQIRSAEEILDILGTDDYNMIGAVCEELSALYEQRDVLTKLVKEEAYIA
jgi:DNA polymerase-3 subunit alpha